MNERHYDPLIMEKALWEIKHNVNFKSNFKTYFIDCECKSSLLQDFKIKKINERKIKFSCRRCGTSKTVIVPRGFSLCKQCNGTGSYEVGSYIPYTCDQCKDGLIAWTEVTK